MPSHTPNTPATRAVDASGPAGNRRLTASTGVVLHTLLWIQVVSALIYALMAFNVPLPTGPMHAVVRPVHFFVGFVLVPLVIIKVASTTYRFARYYTHKPSYKAAGPPSIGGRITGPLMILSITVLLISGIEMWSFANQFDIPWIPVHVISAIIFTVTLAIHVFIHVREAHGEAAADLAGAPAAHVAGEDAATLRRGAITRRSIIGGGLAAGVVLAASASQWPSPSLSWLAPRRAGADPLDFPIMNFEGGGQHVDVAAWRLAVTGEPGLVSRDLSLSYADILAMPAREYEYSIDCVTGWTAVRTWRGVRVADVLRAAGTDPDFGHVLVRSTSGYHWSHHRANILLDGALLVTHINGVVLNDDHGYPVRLLIPGQQGQSNIKWVDGIQVRHGAPDLFVAPNLQYKSQSVSGPGLKPNPVGKRQ